MSEICVECFKKLTGETDVEERFIISDELDLCEECGEFKYVVIAAKGNPMYFFRLFLLPFKLIYYISYGLLRLFMLPFKIYKYKKLEKSKATE